MKWAMSDDYAALISTIIIAALLIGSVQLYTLTRTWVSIPIQTLQEFLQAMSRATAAIRAGNDPAVEDLEGIASAVDPKNAIRKVWPAWVAAAIWMAVCVLLVTLQIKILLWSATGTPKDPDLAKAAFYITAAVVIMLVAEGIIRVFVSDLPKMFKALASHSDDLWPNSAERDRLYRALANHTRGTSPGEDQGTPAQ